MPERTKPDQPALLYPNTVVQCEVCGEDTTQAKGCCTNRRCRTCHARYCTGGGATGPGHYRRWPEQKGGA